jgi:agmatine deiminase
MNTPAVRWPAEWEPHQATWIAWPHNAEDWPGRFGPIPWVFVEVVRLLSRAEPVCILVDERTREQAESSLQKAGVDGARVFLRETITDRVWTRDYLPTFVKRVDNERILAVKWRFNAWAKYENWENDDRAGRLICSGISYLGRLTHFAPSCEKVSPSLSGRAVVLEGGSIDGNGHGTLLTTEECLLSADVQCRNPGFTRADYEAVFAQYLGVRKVLWLKRGIAGDDTHGHVDDLARFVNPTTVATVVEDDPGDVNHDPLRENLELLRGMTDQDGRPLTVVTLPMPAPIVFDGQRLPASYANFYIANNLVLVPTFNDERDRTALATLAELFPDRQVVGVYCGDLIWGLGAIHCMTQQHPEGH